MRRKPGQLSKRRKLPQLILGIAFSGLLIPGTLDAQEPSTLVEFLYPELANYLKAFEVVQAAIIEEIILTNESPQSEIGKELLREQLEELAETKGSHYHTAGNHLAMLGPYRVFESRATPGLVAMLRRQHDQVEADTALAASGAITPAAVTVLRRGHDFIHQLIEIYLDGSILDKKLAVDEAVSTYLADDGSSMATDPKSSDLLSEHPYAYAYRVGFPQLSGLNWAAQWLELATLEVLITTTGDEIAREEAMATVLTLYNDKIARAHNSLVSLPSDIPSVPVIAPNLYSAHSEAAVIIDNLSAFRIALGDILAHPDVADRASATDTLVAQFTNKSTELTAEIDYLLYVLRGGIYNQGGPAKGGMVDSERNRSRSSLENPHVSNLPMPF
ncbi:MAG: hypothetical protein WD772_07985 [Pseudohongiellaceae bacterium]